VKSNPQAVPKGKAGAGKARSVEPSTQESQTASRQAETEADEGRQGSDSKGGGKPNVKPSRQASLDEKQSGSRGGVAGSGLTPAQQAAKDAEQ
jgi:hypothetical protein